MDHNDSRYRNTISETITRDIKNVTDLATINARAETVAVR